MSIKKLLRKIHYYYLCQKWRKQFINIFQHSCYLEEGEYKAIYSDRKIIYRTDVPADFLSMVSRKTASPIARGISIYGDSNQKNVFKGQIAMSTSSGFRYFNYKERTTFREFDSQNSSIVVQKALEVFSLSFKTTVLNITNNYCIEKIVDYNPRRIWDNKTIVDRFCIVMGKYVNYLKKSVADNRVQYKNVEFPILNQDKNFPSACISVYNRIKANLNPTFLYAHILCHHDIHFDNTLFVEHDFYLIDFECAKEDIFFYDFFNIIYVEFMDWHNSTLLDLYLNKNERIMDCLKELFNVVGQEFEISKIKEYFYIFLMKRYMSGIRDLSGHISSQRIMKCTKKADVIYKYVNSR